MGRFDRRRLAELAFVMIGGVGAASAHAAQQASTLTAHAVTATRPAVPLAFTDVTVVDVTSGQLLSDHTVLIVGNRIHAVGPTRTTPLPAGTQVVVAKGKYLVPGFWDMHAHIDGRVATYAQFLAHGVTGVREMPPRVFDDSHTGDHFEQILQYTFPFGADSVSAWQHQVMAGTRAGPRIVGPSADLEWDWVYRLRVQTQHDAEKLADSLQVNADSTGGWMYVYRLPVRTSAEAQRVLDALKAAKVAFVTFRDGTMNNRDIYLALLHAARQAGVPFIGRVPSSVSNVEAADSGVRSVELIASHHQCWPNWPAVPLGDSAAADQRCRPVVDAYVRNGTWMTVGLNSLWLETQYRPEAAPGVWEDMQRFVRLVHRLGMRNFLAGSDWSPVFLDWAPRYRPGLSAAEEMVTYADAGLSPLEALQTGTLNPARFFGATDSLGRVASGQLADLVLLDGNPLADMHNVLKVQAVVANGRYFDRSALDALDPAGPTADGLVAAREHQAANVRRNGTPSHRSP